ncbi:MAG: ABC transporter ATP-binding protein [Thalassobaculum sp.]|uniref:ABC transporter ATP-binding protein n=1 Tax=Thalassobaculum sp. TaxID=2022740 RepID=UPI0032ED297A
MTPAIALDGVSRRYGAVTALQDANLRADPGETVALVGHNGAGKTTLMKLVLGLIRPTAGTVRVLGEDPAGRHGARVRGRIGFLPESVAFHAAMTGAELLDFYARLKGEPRAANAELLERVGLADAASRRVGTYSKGMRQRLALAQALIGEPGILLLDEPTSGLDPESRRQVYETIDDLRRSGALVLLSTHALAEIERQVDRVAMLHRGRLIAVGDVAALRRRIPMPVRIRLRVRHCTTQRVLDRLQGWAETLDRGPTHLQLAVMPECRADLIHALDDLRELIDEVEIESPGLETLYRHLTRGDAT